MAHIRVAGLATRATLASEPPPGPGGKWGRGGIGQGGAEGAGVCSGGQGEVSRGPGPVRPFCGVLRRPLPVSLGRCGPHPPFDAVQIPLHGAGGASPQSHLRGGQASFGGKERDRNTGKLFSNKEKITSVIQKKTGRCQWEGIGKTM